MGLWAIGNFMVINIAGLQSVPTRAVRGGPHRWRRLVDDAAPDHDPADLAGPALRPGDLLIATFQYFTQAYTLTNGRGDPNNATLFINLELFREAFLFSRMGYAAAIAWLLFAIVLRPDRRAVRLRPEARLLRRGRPMTRSARSPTERVVRRPRARSPGATDVPRPRRDARCSPLIIVGAYLLPLLYMVTTSFQQPSQVVHAGRPAMAGGAATGDYEGKEYPIYAVPIDGTTRNLMLVEPGRESSVFVDPNDPTATPIEWQGRWRTL